VLGYCAHTASIGAFAYWAPTFLAERFAPSLAPGGYYDNVVRYRQLFGEWLRAPSERIAGDLAALAKLISEGGESILSGANFYFGIVTVVAGAVGTVLGGRMADRALAGLPSVPLDASHEDPRNRAAANAQLRVCAIGVAVAFPLAALAFYAPSAWMFFTIAGLAEIGLFMSTAPINAIMLRTSPAFLRASAMAVAIFSIHLFGDLWSPVILGSLLDYVIAAVAMLAIPLGFAIATAVWWPRAREAT
jgi:MFS family permease